MNAVSTCGKGVRKHSKRDIGKRHEEKKHKKEGESSWKKSDPNRRNHDDDDDDKIRKKKPKESNDECQQDDYFCERCFRCGITTIFRCGGCFNSICTAGRCMMALDSVHPMPQRCVSCMTEVNLMEQHRIVAEGGMMTRGKLRQLTHSSGQLSDITVTDQTQALEEHEVSVVFLTHNSGFFTRAVVLNSTVTSDLLLAFIGSLGKKNVLCTDFEVFDEFGVAKDIDASLTISQNPIWDGDIFLCSFKYKEDLTAEEIPPLPRPISDPPTIERKTAHLVSRKKVEERILENSTATPLTPETVIGSEDIAEQIALQFNDCPDGKLLDMTFIGFQEGHASSSRELDLLIQLGSELRVRARCWDDAILKELAKEIFLKSRFHSFRYGRVMWIGKSNNSTRMKMDCSIKENKIKDGDFAVLLLVKEKDPPDDDEYDDVVHNRDTARWERQKVLLIEKPSKNNDACHDYDDEIDVVYNPDISQWVKQEKAVPLRTPVPATLRILNRTIQIFVIIKIDGCESRTLTIETSLSETCKALKQKIFQKSCIAAHLLRMSFESKEMEDDRLLSDYNIRPQANIFLNGKIGGGEASDVQDDTFVQTKPCGGGHATEVQRVFAVLREKRHFHDIRNFNRKYRKWCTTQGTVPGEVHSLALMNDGVGDGQLELCLHAFNVMMLYARIMAELCCLGYTGSKGNDEEKVVHDVVMQDQMYDVMDEDVLFDGDEMTDCFTEVIPDGNLCGGTLSGRRGGAISPKEIAIIVNAVIAKLESKTNKEEGAVPIPGSAKGKDKGKGKQFATQGKAPAAGKGKGKMIFDGGKNHIKGNDIGSKTQQVPPVQQSVYKNYTSLESFKPPIKEMWTTVAWVPAAAHWEGSYYSWQDVEKRIDNDEETLCLVHVTNKDLVSEWTEFQKGCRGLLHITLIREIKEDDDLVDDEKSCTVPDRIGKSAALRTVAFRSIGKKAPGIVKCEKKIAKVTQGKNDTIVLRVRSDHRFVDNFKNVGYAGIA